MIMVVIVVMVMMGLVVILVRVGIEHLGADRRLRHLGELENVVHHLVLEDRRPELGEELGVAAVIVVDLPLLPRKLPDALEQCTAHLVVGNGDLTAPTHLRQDQPKPDPPRGNVVIFLARLLLGGAFVGEASFGALEVGRHLVPDGLELVVDKGGRQLEAMAFIEGIEQRPFQLEPRGLAAVLL